MTRPADPRRANRRGSDNADIGYANIEPQRHISGARWQSPRTHADFANVMHQRETTGACVVCGEPTDMPGVTCKATRCVRAFLFGRIEPTPDSPEFQAGTVERLEY